MLKLGRVTKVKVLFLVLVFAFNFDLFKFSAAILEKGLLHHEFDSESESNYFSRIFTKCSRLSNLFFYIFIYIFRLAA